MERQINLNIKIPADLITINCNNPLEGAKALEFSSKNIEFNNVLLFTDKKIKGSFDLIKIKKITDVGQYNNFILKLDNYIKSPYVIVIQDDGHIVNPEKWSDQFLNYDYIGAPWPNDKKWNARWLRYNEIGQQIIKNSKFNQIGNGGFSLRSKKFLEYSKQYENTKILAEDVFLNIYNYENAKNFGIKYPDISTAIDFSYETPLKGKNLNKEKRNQEYNFDEHFGWHGKRFLNYSDLMDLKN